MFSDKIIKIIATKGEDNTLDSPFTLSQMQPTLDKTIEKSCLRLLDQKYYDRCIKKLFFFFLNIPT